MYVYMKQYIYIYIYIYKYIIKKYFYPVIYYIYITFMLQFNNK